MLESIADLPTPVVGLRARGRLDREDHDDVMRPLIEGAHDRGSKLRLLYELGPDLEGVTLSAALEEARLLREHAADVERCAIVSDSRTHRAVAAGAARLSPFPMRVYDPLERHHAIDWLTRPARVYGLARQMVHEQGVLIVRPFGALDPEDLQALGRTLDSLIDAEPALRGLVVHSRALLPQWSSLGTMLGHLQLVRSQHRKLGRVALAVSHPVAATALAAVLSRVLAPEVRSFRYGDLHDAVHWAAAGGPRAASPAPPALDRVQQAGIESFPASDPPSFTPEA